ncbi:MAG: RlpA-like double-psi beta-barrel domain-containing protein [Solirubrobacteraceae bacterium]
MALAMVGCGANSRSTAAGRSTAAHTSSTVAAPLQRSHPQAVEPTVGSVARGGTRSLQAAAAAPPPGVPIAPASIGGRAKGAPTDEEVRAEVARFQRAVALYHLDRLALSGDLLNLATLGPGQFFVSIASVYTDYGLPIACGGVLHIPQLGVANKTLPCGTEVTFVYGGRAIRVPVIDRGPYIAGRVWDLTGAAAEALQFPGLGPIQWRIG